MKLLSIVVCCYNSQDYMAVAVESLLKGGEDVEIIIVDDGSKDNTGKIADEYQAKYPSIIKVVHQPNGGHGAGVQAGIREATGKFFKVVDSDDWVDEQAYKTMLQKIVEVGDEVDMFINDYRYVHKDKETGEELSSQPIHYQSVFPMDKVIGFDGMKRMKISQNFLIHSTMFKTQLLKDSNLQIPIHTFYEDDYCIYAPLKNVNTMCYVPVCLYCYFVGRDGQSVQKDVAVRRYNDYLKVAMACIKEYDPYSFLNNKAKFRVIYHHIRIFVSLGWIHTKMNNSKEAKANLKAFMKEFKQVNKRLYRRLRYFSLISPLVFVNPFGLINSNFTYAVSRKIVKFN